VRLAVVASVLAAACSGAGEPRAAGPATQPQSQPREPQPEPEPAPAPAPLPVAELPIPEVEPAPPPDPRAETLDLAFAGDVMFGRYVSDGFREIPAERIDPFKRVARLLDSDFTMVNLETPVVRDIPDRSPHKGKYRFVTNKERVASLLDGNVDAVTLANNHAYDMRMVGVVETPEILDEIGLTYVGAHRYEPPILRAESVEVKGWKIAYVAATTERNAHQRKKDPELPFAEREALEAALLPVIEEARPRHDLVIVVLHWGDEYKEAPDDWQVSAARAFVDAGADAVIAHHPHVLQGIERYGKGLIAYSLGNLLFDNLRPTRRLHGILHLQFRRDGSCLDGAVFHPTVGTERWFTPKPAGDEFDDVAKRLRKLSKREPLIETEWTIDGETLTVDGACD
jgi:poly-gamma-glutamate synthesis protein (capsule biosynthesis protein)